MTTSGCINASLNFYMNMFLPLGVLDKVSQSLQEILAQASILQVEFPVSAQAMYLATGMGDDILGS